MEDMLEALRAQQQIEEDAGEYIDRRNAFYRESNRQASEAYIRNLEDIGKDHTEEVVEDRDENKNARTLYNSRIQDISRNHIQKLIKSKLEASSFKDIKRMVDPDDPDDREDDAPAKPAKPYAGRMRPEVGKLLEHRRQELPPAEPLPEESAAAGEAEVPEGRDLLESAISKLKQRLGGAHNSTAAKAGDTLKPVLDSQQSYDNVKPQAAPIRTDLDQVQASIQRARALRAAADGTQYVPLEDADVQKILIENKLPIDYGTVQMIKATSRRLQDSSYYFQRAAAFIVHAGLEVQPHLTSLVVDTFRQFEKYQRPSIMSKLLRYVQSQRLLQFYHRLGSGDGLRPDGSRLELGEAMMLQDAMPGRGRSALMPKISREELKIIHNQARSEGMNLPDIVDDATLRSGLQHLLKEMGLPTSKVMIQQLAQSAQNSTLRAQALVFQLAARRSLHPDEVSQLQQRLEELTPQERAQSPLKLMETLGLPLPERPTVKQTTEALLKTLLRQFGIAPPLMENQPQAREAILLVHQLGERTDTLHLLIPKLAESIRRQPEFWIKRLAEHLPKLQALLAGEPIKLPQDLKGAFVQGLQMALELPSTRTRAMNRIEQLLTKIKSQPEVIQAKGETVVSQATGETGPVTAKAVLAAQDGPSPASPPQAQAAEAPAQRPDARAAGSPNTPADATSLPAGPTAAKASEGSMAPPVTDQSMSQGASPSTAGEPTAAAVSAQAGSPAAAPAAGPNAQNLAAVTPEAGQIAAALAEQSPAGGPASITPQAAGAAQLDPQLPPGSTSPSLSEPLRYQRQPASNPLAGRQEQALAGESAGPAIPPAADDALEGLPAWPAELNRTYPLAREALVVLRLQAQRTDQLNQLQARIAPLLEQQPEALLHQLERMAPALEEWRGNTSPKPETLQHLLGQLEKAVLPQAPSAESRPGLIQPEHQVARALTRFYPQLDEAGRGQALKQLLGASPALMDGFYQMHRLLGQLDTGKSQILTPLWSRPETYPRLAALGQVLAPVLEAVGLSPERRYLTPPTLQNQLIQGLQTWLQQGRPEMLQSALQAWLTPVTSGRSPMGKLKEQLTGYGLPELPEPLLEDIWTLSEGSADRVDAMAMLLRGGFPLLKANIQVLQPYLEQLPPQQRRDGVSDLLMHFSPQLIKLIDREIASQSDLGRFGTLLEQNLPLTPENWRRVETSPLLPDFARGLQVSELKNRLEVVQSVLTGQPAEDLGQLVQVLDRIQIQLRMMAQTPPSTQPGAAPVMAVAELETLAGLFRQLLLTVPSGFAPRTPSAPGQPAGLTPGLPAVPLPGQPPAQPGKSGQQPNVQPGQAQPEPATLAALPLTPEETGMVQTQAQSWVQLLQASPVREQPVLLMQLQDQLSGLFFQVRSLLPRLEARSQVPFETVTPQPEALAQRPPAQEPEQPLPQLELDAIEQQLQHWGLRIQNPEMLGQIRALVGGDRDKLDAVAVLLKGQLPLLPAHLEIVTRYVRELPPSERFTSISKILSFLSDELIQHMQQQLGEQRQAQRQNSFPGLDAPEAERAEALLDEMPRPLTEQKMQAAHLLVSSPLPQQTGQLKALSQLLTGRPLPQQLMGPLQSLLGQMQSLLPQNTLLPAQAAVLAELQQSLTEMLNLLQPRSSQIGNWMMGVGTQLASVGERLQQQINSLRPASAPAEHWLDGLVSSLLALCGWIESEEPHKQEQLERFRQQLKEHLPGLRQNLDALSFFHAAEAMPQAPQQSQPQLSQYLPTLIQHLGYPVEILIQPETDQAQSTGSRGTQVQLTIQTHTMGQLYLGLRFSGTRLDIRIGLERRELQRWLAPYLEALQQKLGHLPWSVGTIQTYVVPAQTAGAPVLAHHLYKRYSRQAIDRL